MNALAESSLPAVLLPRPRPLGRAYAALALNLVGRAFQVASRLDPDLRAELAGVAPGTSLALRVRPSGPEVRLVLREGGRVMRQVPARGSSPAEPDVLLRFTSLAAALRVLGFSASAFEVYAKGGFAVSGDLRATMAFIRALGVLETILLPGFLARKVLKRPYRIPLGRLLAERAALYAGLAFAVPERIEA